MTIDEVKQKAHEYIDSNLAKDENWLDDLTDSWIYDAESWFLDQLAKEMTIYEDEVELEYTKEAEELVHEFWGEVRKYHDEEYVELYGVRDATFILHGLLYDLREKYGNTIEKVDGYLQGSGVSNFYIDRVKKALSNLTLETNMLLKEVKEKNNYEEENF